MQKLLFALILIFTLTFNLNAQTIKLPEKLTVVPNRLTPVTIEYDGDDIAFTTDGDADVFREYSRDDKEVRLRVIVYKEGTFKLKVIVSKDKKLSDFAVCTLTTSKIPPGPDPDPDPGPTPPEPTDPLYQALKMVWEQETSFSKVQEKNKLAAIYDAAVEFVKKPVDKTQGELIARIAAAAKKDVGEPTKVLPLIRKVIKQYLDSKLTTKVNDPIDPKSAEAFTAIARALEALR